MMATATFGKRKSVATPPEARTVKALQIPASCDPWLPWTSVSAILEATRAINDVRDIIIAKLGEHGAHPGTLLAATGAIAGFAAQHSVWTNVINTGKGRLARDLQVVTVDNGHRYFLGGLPFSLLATLGAQSFDHATLTEVLVGAARAAGARDASMPLAEDVLTRSIEAMAPDKEFGKIPAPAGHEPRVLPRAALELVWPGVKRIYSAPSAPFSNGFPVERWTLLTAVLAHRLIELSKPVIEPNAAATLVLEAAVRMSMLDPETIPPFKERPDRGTAPRIVELPAGRGGHFYADALVNGKPVHVLVDTGATGVAMTFEAAVACGISLDASDYTNQASTANGVAMTAPAYFESISIGPIEVRNVAGAILPPGAGSETLLGMSFLSKLKSVQLTAGKLVLEE